MNDSEGGPVTFASIDTDSDGFKKPSEVVLTGKNDVMTEQSIDYIFELIPVQDSHFDLTKSADQRIFKSSSEFKFQKLNSKLFKIDHSSIKVEPFKVTHEKVTHLSDHLGLSIDLWIEK